MVGSKFMKFTIIFISVFLFACQDKSNKNGSINNLTSDVKDTALFTEPVTENNIISKPQLSYLLEYKDKNVFQKDLFRKEPLLSKLKKALNSEYQFLIDCCYTESNIKVIDNNIVIIEACQTHNCPGVFYVVYVDVNANNVFVGLFNEGEVNLYSEGNAKYPNWMLNWKDEQEKEYAKYNTETSMYSERNVENFKIGDEVHVGNFVYLVRKIEFTKTVENTFTEQKADGIYLIVYLAVLNKSRESRTLSNSMFKVFDSDGYEYETSQNAITILVLNDQDKVFLFKDIPPKIPKEIIMPFEVPNSNDIYTLQVSGGFWTGETAKIDLQN